MLLHPGITTVDQKLSFSHKRTASSIECRITESRAWPMRLEALVDLGVPDRAVCRMIVLALMIDYQDLITIWSEVKKFND